MENQFQLTRRWRLLPLVIGAAILILFILAMISGGIQKWLWRPRPRHDQSKRHRTPILRLPGTRRAVWARRRHHRAGGGGDVAAIRARERAARDRLLYSPG